MSSTTPPHMRWFWTALVLTALHIAATIFFAILMIAYDAHANWPDRPWNQTAAIAVFDMLVFPAEQILGEHDEILIVCLPLNSALVGAVLATPALLLSRGRRVRRSRGIQPLRCRFLPRARSRIRPRIRHARQSTWTDPERAARELPRAGIDHLAIRTDRPYLQALRNLFRGRDFIGRGTR